MLRKVGFLFALMLTVPAMANAWTIAAKISSPAGTMSGVTWGTTSYSTQTITAGSAFYNYTTSNQTTGAKAISITPSAGYKVSLVTLDGVKQSIAEAGGSVTLAKPAAPKYSYSVVAYFSPQSYTVTLDQPAAGGKVVAQMLNSAGTKVIGSISRTAIANIPNNSKVRITALPNADYRVVSVNGDTAKSSTIPGLPKYKDITVTADVPAATVAFELVPYVKPSLVATSAAAIGNSNFVGSTITAGTAVTFDASGTRTNAGPIVNGVQTGVSYAWSGCGVTDANSPSRAFVPVDASGTCTITVTATSASTPSATASKSMTLTLNSAANDVTAVCVSCHTNRDEALVTQFNSSAYTAATSCQACHTEGPHNLVKCATCHTGPAEVKAGTRQSHAFTAAGPTNPGCVGCHDVARKFTGGAEGTPHATAFVDNVGVRAVTGEFAKWSHHVTGVALKDAHCAACHLEGKVVDGQVVVDKTKHMADKYTHLRNADTDADYQWNPSAPDHTLMDNFCMSCHDSNGATSIASVAVQAVINTNGYAASGKTASPGNPFGDTISNRYDKMQRPAVVDAKGQFDLSNPSHHAVMGKKYNKRTRVVNANDPRAMTAAEVAAFTNNSGAVANVKTVGARSTIYDSRAVRTAAGTGHNAAYNVSKFVESYQTLSPAVVGSTDKTLGDDSVLHCGDCHTVGQYRQADVGVLPKNAAAIGAHGSNNEYMLRNSVGTDERHVGQTYNSLNGVNYFTNPNAPLLVCFNCHSYQNYGSIGNSTGATGTNHAGEYANSNRCNGPVNTITFSGYTTNNDIHEPYAFRLGLGQRDGVITGSTSTSDTDFSNLFGMQCANCHNSGPNNLFGGIHGSKVKTYADANGAAQNAYRFLPGLGNTMYVPGSASGVGTVSDLNWEVKSIGTVYNGAKTAVVDNGGCYTIVPETDDGLNATTASYALSPAFEQTVDQPAAGTHIFGTWGGCDDHRGNAHGKAFSNNGVPAGDYTGGTVATGGAGVTRKVLRPVTY